MVSAPNREVLVRVLALDIVLCSWARQEKGDETKRNDINRYSTETSKQRASNISGGTGHNV